MEKITTADLYIRVSTDEQADTGYSLNYQEEHLRSHCEKNNIIVKSVFREDYSAKTFNRPQIKKMLSLYQKASNRPNYLLFTKWDRFSRDISASYEMLGKMEKLGIESIAVDQPIDMNIPESQLMRAVYLAAPMAENLRRSKNVFEGMRKAKKEGRYMGSTPCGYKNITTENGKKVIIPMKMLI